MRWLAAIMIVLVMALPASAKPFRIIVTEADVPKSPPKVAANNSCVARGASIIHWSGPIQNPASGSCSTASPGPGAAPSSFLNVL